jgi:prevent-host-death family protein
MAKSVDISQARRTLSALMDRAALTNERFLIHDDGKPVAAIVSANDLERLESAAITPKRGLLAAVGALSEFEDWSSIMEEVVRDRQNRTDRPVKIDF